MNRVTVENLGKCYRWRRDKNFFSAWPRLEKLAQFGGLKPLAKRPPREIWALKDVSFTVESGAILGIIGANGAGKTTLLKIIARVTPPTEGRVIGRGRVVSLLEAGLGFQPDLSGRENIFLYAAMYDIPRSEMLKRFDAIVEFAEVENAIDRPLRHYSSGMFLRLAFSVALNMGPDILLADEVLAVGDLAFQERCLQRVQEAEKEGMAVLFVSHDMAAISRLCRRVIWLDAGRIVRDGDPEELVTLYQDTAWLLANTKFRGDKKSDLANQYGKVLSIRLISAGGKEIGAVRISEDVFVKLTFQIFQARVNVRCLFNLFTNGIRVFRSVQPEEFPVPTEGIYSGIARIPAHFLAETIYTIKANVTIVHDGELWPLIVDNALSFQVYNSNESLSARGSYKGKLPGVVMPRLEWRMMKEHDVSRT